MRQSQPTITTSTPVIPLPVATAAPLSVVDGAPLDFLRMIESFVTNPAVDVEKFDRLLQMQTAVMARQAELEFNAAMLKVHSEVPVVVADKQNPVTHSRYASMEKLDTILKPICLANGFTSTFAEGEAPVDGRLHIIATVRHVGGHTEVFNRYPTTDTAGPKGLPNKTEVQGEQSSVSYITRRLKCAIWGVTVVEEDRDGNAPVAATIDATQVATLQKLMGAVKQNTARFFGYYGISTLAELPLTEYADAVQELEDKLAKLKKAVA